MIEFHVKTCTISVFSIAEFSFVIPLLLPKMFEPLLYLSFFFFFKEILLKALIYLIASRQKKLTSSKVVFSTMLL